MSIALIFRLNSAISQVCPVKLKPLASIFLRVLAGLPERPFSHGRAFQPTRLTNTFSTEVGQPLKKKPMQSEKSTPVGWETALREAESLLEIQQERVARLKAAIRVFRSNLKNKVPWPEEMEDPKRNG